MNDNRPKPEQPKDQTTPNADRDPSRTGAPGQPTGNDPKRNERESTQAKP